MALVREIIDQYDASRLPLDGKCQRGSGELMLLEHQNYANLVRDPVKKPTVNKTARDFWLLLTTIFVLATALAVAWYVYVPGAPATEQGHVRH